MEFSGESEEGTDVMFAVGRRQQAGAQGPTPPERESLGSSQKSWRGHQTSARGNLGE